MANGFGFGDPGWGQQWPAPAKLNLMLKIVGRRSDGYHLLQTVFQFIDYCDWLTFFHRRDGAIKLTSPLPGVREADDLTVRAARFLQKESGISQGVEIEVEKKLPMGGGLGGGSSDAATTLVALNRLWGCNLSVDRLCELALELGADVPVFVRGKSAWAEGVGEILKPVSLREDWYVVVVPECHVSTQKVFSSPLLTRDSEPIKIADFALGQNENDCVNVVSTLYPPVREALAALSAFGVARLTGTGGCVFAVFDNPADAMRAKGRLGGYRRVIVAKGLNSSPLFDKIPGGNRLPKN